jgi:ABC-type nickel/cobalt efflux system permease component RcnA
MNTTEWLVIGGLLLIFILAGYAAWLWYRVWRNRQRQLQQRHERNTRLAEDIRILARGLVEDQIPLIEAAIRIKVLLDNYSGPRRADLDVQVFADLYDATAHIPTHQTWKDLPLVRRHEHEQLMTELEQQHRGQLQQAARALLGGLQ